MRRTRFGDELARMAQNEARIDSERIRDMQRLSGDERKEALAKHRQRERDNRRAAEQMASEYIGKG